MRYQSLEPVLKDSYVSPNWTNEELDMVVKADASSGTGERFLLTKAYEGS